MHTWSLAGSLTHDSQVPILCKGVHEELVIVQRDTKGIREEENGPRLVVLALGFGDVCRVTAAQVDDLARSFSCVV